MDLKAKKASVARLLDKVTTQGLVTKKTDVSGGTDQTAPVRVRIITRTAELEEPAKCEAVMTATSFPVEGAELLLKGVTYDIVSSVQKGVGDEHLMQRVVLHER
ncbi:hypothetical protein [Sphingobium sp. KCTC 72723]|uniref:hypothetical protein n=1 Tax=Sphingobium sp. KCTC 72723 TaxID=2733867 RepID=UPI00165D93EF|nr:hypothetical protein [Sphingobium sp. KCTC 72723]